MYPSADVAGITQYHIDGLNYFLCGLEEEVDRLEYVAHRFVEGSFDLPDGKIWALNSQEIRIAQQVRGYGAFSQDIDGLRKGISSSRQSLEQLLSELSKLEDSGPTAEVDGMRDIAHHHFYQWRRLLTAIESMLVPNVPYYQKEAHSSPRRNRARKAREDMQDLAIALQVLIRAKDKRFQWRTVRNITEQRLGRTSTKGLKPSRQDLDTWRDELCSSVKEPIRVVNDYLEFENASYRLFVDRISIGFDVNLLWRRLQAQKHFRIPSLARKIRMVGQPPSGLLGALFQPFIDHVLNLYPGDDLGVCEHAVCGRVFIRESKGHKKQFCTSKCRRAAADD